MLQQTLHKPYTYLHFQKNRKPTTNTKQRISHTSLSVATLAFNRVCRLCEYLEKYYQDRRQFKFIFDALAPETASSMNNNFHNSCAQE